MSDKKFYEYKQLDLVKFEHQILEKWDQQHTFQESIALRKNSPPFVFFEGPPSANGLPGIHHVISRTIKDMFCRYKTMKGFSVDRKAGWDTHGLPVELNVEKKLGITKKDVGEKISIEDYNNTCRTEVLRYKHNWDELTKRIGFWVDLEHPYVTFDNNYIESVWWSLQRLYNAKKLYKDITIQPYSPAAGTGLSSHELNQPGTYKMVKDTSIIALFEVVDKTLFPVALDNPHPLYIMAWTTTPWTLPSNLALAVNQKFSYVCVHTTHPYFPDQKINVVVAEELLPSYFTEKNKEAYQWEVKGKCLGKSLLELKYHPLFSFEANSPDHINGNPFRVIHSDHVNTESGTGIVHMAPAFGEDDFKACKKNGVGFICLVDREGKFVDGVGEYSGREVKDFRDTAGYQDVNVDICVDLKKRGQAFYIQKYEHSYPHCWRTDKPVLYYPLDAWFVKVSEDKDQLVEINKTINWKPASTGEGRFGNWLLSAQDWNLSRSRFWGTPLPIWRTADGKEEICIGSIEDLTTAYLHSVSAGNMQDIFPVVDGKIAMDLHKPHVDKLVLTSTSGQPMYRESDLIDVWYDSGAMPFAQWHYPFENKEKFESHFPADFICEGVDQTRGWFYTLHVLGVLLFGKPAYRNVVSNGLVLDKNGNKMSKRLGNVVDPVSTIARYGADATRWYMMTSSSPWENMRFDLGGLEDTQRKLYGTLYNTYNFFALYANLDNFTYSEHPTPVEKRTDLDRWIISKLYTLIARYHQDMDDYEPMMIHRLIHDFVNEELSNWYVRLSRARFWKSAYGEDKIMAYQTLYECLEKIAQLMAPLSPFFSEWLFDNLNRTTSRFAERSVHHTLLPAIDNSLIHTHLEEKMKFAQDVCSLALSLRKTNNIKVRQPLQTLLVSASNEMERKYLQETEDIIKQELNVKEILFLGSDNNVVTKELKPNYKSLGKKVGAMMPKIAEMLSGLSQEEIETFEKNNSLTLRIDEHTFSLTQDDVLLNTKEIKGWSTASKDNVRIALDLNVSEELKKEGIVREFINRIQNLRKKMGLEVIHKIDIKVEKNAEVIDAILEYSDYICQQVLASTLDVVEQINATSREEIEVDGNIIFLILTQH